MTYTGNVFEIRDDTAPSVTANVLTTAAAGIARWVLNSNGFIDSQGGAQFRAPIQAPTSLFSAGETISSGGINAYSGVSIAGGGLVVANGQAIVTSPALTTSVASQYASAAGFTASVLALSSSRGASSLFRCVAACTLHARSS